MYRALIVVGLCVMAIHGAPIAKRSTNDTMSAATNNTNSTAQLAWNIRAGIDVLTQMIAMVSHTYKCLHGCYVVC